MPDIPLEHHQDWQGECYSNQYHPEWHYKLSYPLPLVTLLYNWHLILEILRSPVAEEHLWLFQYPNQLYTMWSNNDISLITYISKSLLLVSLNTSSASSYFLLTLHYSGMTFCL